MSKYHIPDDATIGIKYDTIASIDNVDDANAYLEACIEHNMRVSDHSREEAKQIERFNIGYYSGYFDTKTGRRVQQLFAVVHPVFGMSITTCDSNPIPHGR